MKARMLRCKTLLRVWVEAVNACCGGEIRQKAKRNLSNEAFLFVGTSFQPNAQI